MPAPKRSSISNKSRAPKSTPSDQEIAIIEALIKMSEYVDNMVVNR